MWLKTENLERLESAYLQALRIAGLVIATLCLIAAIAFAANALWRLAVTTDVAPEPTSVDSSTIAQQIVAQSEPQGNDKTGDASDPATIAYNEFKSDFWPKYYEVYKSAYQKYTNNSDPLVESDELIVQLGYTLDFFRETLGENDFGEAAVYADRIQRMVSDPSYQEAALKHVTEAMNASVLQPKFSAYKTATKSEERCTTTPRSERVRRTCGYYYVYDCSYTRTVQVRRCEAVFPETVLTPAMAFARADMIFAESWLYDEAIKRDIARTERAKRQETRAAIGPNLQLALMIIAGFFVVMFFFLLVAIERHLRPKKEPE